MARIGNRTAPGRYTLGRWKNQEAQDAQTTLEQQVINTDRLTVVRCVYRSNVDFPSHFHPQEQITIVEEGTLLFEIGGDHIEVGEGQMVSIPAHVRHATRVKGSRPARALNLFVFPEGAPTRRHFAARR